MGLSSRLLVLVLGLAGCAPSAQSLVHHHHDREALCALDGADADDQVILREGLERDLAPRVEVARIDVGPDGFHAMQVRVATNAIPIDELRLRAVPANEDVVPWGLHSLAELTREKLPSSREVTAGPVEGFATFFIAALTVGLVRLEITKPHTEYPSDSEIRAAAPQAYELSRMLASECATPSARGVAARCTFVFAVQNEARSPATDIEIEMSAHPERRGQCRMTKTFRVPLERTTGAFGAIP